MRAYARTHKRKFIKPQMNMQPHTQRTCEPVLYELHVANVVAVYDSDADDADVRRRAHGGTRDHAGDVCAVTGAVLHRAPMVVLQRHGVVGDE